jgi:23S rRNA pseudouridine1911/1915/1917 synthase
LGLAPENLPLEILHEDEYLLIVNKPAGMASHPAAGINSGTLVNALLYHCKTLSCAGQDRPGIVHRLDRDTSGLMVVAKDDGTHHRLAEQFKERQVRKRYIAFVKGLMELDEGKIELPIGRHPTQRQKQAVRFGESREAVTEYRVIKRFFGKDAATKVELTPKTGRMHQLRVHLSYIGHPILGDLLYGEKSALILRQALHASRLGFRHPVSGKDLEFNAEIPADMTTLEKKLAILR